MVGDFTKTNDFSRYILSASKPMMTNDYHFWQKLYNNIHFPIYIGLHHHSSFLLINVKNLLVSDCIQCSFLLIYVKNLLVDDCIQCSFLLFNLKILVVDDCSSWVKSGKQKCSTNIPQSSEHSHSPQVPASSDLRWPPPHMVAAASWLLAKHEVWFGSPTSLRLVWLRCALSKQGFQISQW